MKLKGRMGAVWAALPFAIGSTTGGYAASAGIGDDEGMGFE
jgi:hypothetical protein